MSRRPRFLGNVSGGPILTRKNEGAAKPKKAAARKAVAKKAVAKKAIAKKAVVKKAVSRKAAASKAGKAKSKPAKTLAPQQSAEPALLERIRTSLDDDKAEDIVTIDLQGRSSLADSLVIASGRSARHVASIAEHLARKLKDAGYGARPIDGLPQGDWVLVDAGDVIVHVFRPEVRSYYDLEGMWSVPEPERAAAI